MSQVRGVTFGDALSGRWHRLAAIGVGSLAVGRLFAGRLAIAVPLLILAMAVAGGGRLIPRRR